MDQASQKVQSDSDFSNLTQTLLQESDMVKQYTSDQIEFFMLIIQEKSLLSAEIVYHDILTEQNSSRQYVGYTILVNTSVLDFKVVKRYSEFHHLMKELENYYSDKPQIKQIIDKFPGKRLFGNFDASFIELRKNKLNEFIFRLVEKYDQFKLFLFLEFLEIRKQFLFQDIKNYDIKNKVSKKQFSVEEENLASLIQQLNGNNDDNIQIYKQLEQYFQKNKPIKLSAQMIKLILLGEKNQKGLIQLSGKQDDTMNNSHLVCSQGMSILCQVLDFEYNREAEIFLQVFQDSPISQVKMLNFASHILQSQKKCKQYALKLLHIYLSRNLNIKWSEIMELVDQNQEILDELQKWRDFRNLTSPISNLVNLNKNKNTTTSILGHNSTKSILSISNSNNSNNNNKNGNNNSKNGSTNDTISNKSQGQQNQQQKVEDNNVKDLQQATVMNIFQIKVNDAFNELFYHISSSLKQNKQWKKIKQQIDQEGKRISMYNNKAEFIYLKYTVNLDLEQIVSLHIQNKNKWDLRIEQQQRIDYQKKQMLIQNKTANQNQIQDQNQNSTQQKFIVIEKYSQRNLKKQKKILYFMKVIINKVDDTVYICKKSVKNINKYQSQIQDQNCEIGKILQLVAIQKSKNPKSQQKYKVKSLTKLQNDAAISFFVTEMTGESTLIFKGLQRLQQLSENELVKEVITQEKKFTLSEEKINVPSECFQENSLPKQFKRLSLDVAPKIQGNSQLIEEQKQPEKSTLPIQENILSIKQSDQQNIQNQSEKTMSNSEKQELDNKNGNELQLKVQAKGSSLLNMILD